MLESEKNQNFIEVDINPSIAEERERGHKEKDNYLEGQNEKLNISNPTAVEENAFTKEDNFYLSTKYIEKKFEINNPLEDKNHKKEDEMKNQISEKEKENVYENDNYEDKLSYKVSYTTVENEEKCRSESSIRLIGESKIITDSFEFRICTEVKTDKKIKE